MGHQVGAFPIRRILKKLFILGQFPGLIFSPKLTSWPMIFYFIYLFIFCLLLSFHQDVRYLFVVRNLISSEYRRQSYLHRLKLDRQCIRLLAGDSACRPYAYVFGGLLMYAVFVVTFFEVYTWFLRFLRSLLYVFFVLYYTFSDIRV